MGKISANDWGFLRNHTTNMTKVSRKDARLARSALSMAQGFLESQLGEKQVGGMIEQRRALYGNYEDAFNGVADTVDKGAEDIRGLWRLVRKVRALRE